MPRLEYERIDFVLRIDLPDDTDALVVTAVGERDPVEIPYRPAGLGKAPERRLAKELSSLADLVTARLQRTHADAIARIVLDIRNSEAAALPWERALHDILEDRNVWPGVVRTTPVLQRDSGQWTLPLRFLFVTPSGSSGMAVWPLQVFGDHPPDRVAEAVRTIEIPVDVLGDWRPTPEWPTAEIIHFDRYPSVSETRLLGTASPGTIGTLGWLNRFTDTAQAKLVVIRCESEREMRIARAIGRALVQRGGPAVLAVCPRKGEQMPNIYDDLVHDRPLDWIAQSVQHRSHTYACFVGGGREDALRVSGPANELLHIAEALLEPETSAEVDEELREIAGGVEADEGGSAIPPLEDRLRQMRESLDHVRTRWSDFQFEEHESRGLIPYSGSLGDARRAAFGGRRAPLRRAGSTRFRRAARKPELRPAARFVNPSLWSDTPNTERIDQRNARLVPGRTYHLGISIGPRDEQTVTLNAAAIFEEAFRWRPEDEGTWIEVAVTGIDFEVVGDPVQELWLPREGETDLLRFAIVPARPGPIVLRFCIFHRQNLVQSFRLAAYATAGKPQDADAKTVAAALAGVLGIDVERIGNAGWIGRLEYSRVADPSRISRVPERALSIIANRQGDRNVLTVKGADEFLVEFPGAITDRVRRMRRDLDEIAKPPVPGVPEAQWNYGFGDGVEPNAGDNATLERALIRLATAGWSLYTQLISGPRRGHLSRLLLQPDRVIHVAHVLIDKVVPWSLIYDRPFTASEQIQDDGTTVRPTACLAALPDANGDLTATACGTHPECLLHHMPSESVACPLAFWGFRHVLEIPPQQADADAEAGHDEADTIEAGAPVVLVGGLNESLGLADAHATALEDLAASLNGKAQWKVLERRGHEIVRVLNDPDLDLIYLFCHARGGVVDPEIGEPCIEFVGLDQPRRIISADLANGSYWAHRPLVVLNGCGTVGFSPDALSPFLPIMVRDRGAAGILGTEISVYEPLGTEFAVLFLESFLSGESAGRSLLRARRRLLAQKNPLGLAYTLYANADLTLGSSSQPGDVG